MVKANVVDGRGFALRPAIEILALSQPLQNWPQRIYGGLAQGIVGLPILVYDPSVFIYESERQPLEASEMPIVHTTPGVGNVFVRSLKCGVVSERFVVISPSRLARCGLSERFAPTPRG